MPGFLKPELPGRAAKVAKDLRQLVVAEEGKERLQPGETFVVRTKMPNTAAYWSDLMLGNAAFKSYNDNFRLTCLSAMQQRAKNNVPRQPRKVHWDHLLDEAGWLRRDFREERMWKIQQARKRAVECMEAWRLRLEGRGRFVEDGEATGSMLGYRREREGRHEDLGWQGPFVLRTRVSGKDAGGDVLGKRKWNAGSHGVEDVQDRLKRPKTLRRFSCRVDDSI